MCLEARRAARNARTFVIHLVLRLSTALGEPCFVPSPLPLPECLRDSTRLALPLPTPTLGRILIAPVFASSLTSSALSASDALFASTIETRVSPQANRREATLFTVLRLIFS